MQIAEPARPALREQGARAVAVEVGDDFSCLESVTTVPTGTRSSTSDADFPYWSAPRPLSPSRAR